MALDPATVRRIATLARIRMEDAEVATLVGNSTPSSAGSSS